MFAPIHRADSICTPHSILLLFACIATTGCAVDNQGVGGSVVYFKNESDTGRAIQLNIVGIHLATDELDAGLYLGHVQQTLYYAGGNSSGDARTVMNFVQDDQGSLLKPVAESEGKVWELGQPLAIASRRIGVGIGLTSGIRLQLGLQQRAALALPSQSNLLVVQKRGTPATGSYPPGVHFTVKEYAP